MDPAPFDAYAPAEIARRVSEIGVKKAAMDTGRTLVLGVLAGAFIALGATFYAVVITGATMFGLARFAGALAFSLGLVLVVVAGAELFTGNNLLTIAWASKKITTRALLRNWSLVYVGNAVGAITTAGFVAVARTHDLGGGAVGKTFVAIAVAKTSEPMLVAFARGVLCNALVCLAVWLCFGARSVADKVSAILLPISAFVACGFEHSIANLFLLPLALFVRGEVDPGAALSAASSVANVAAVTLGNVVGGAGLVAIVYWFAYSREPDSGTQ